MPRFAPRIVRAAFVGGLGNTLKPALHVFTKIGPVHLHASGYTVVGNLFVIRLSADQLLKVVGECVTADDADVACCVNEAVIRGCNRSA